MEAEPRHLQECGVDLVTTEPTRVCPEPRVVGVHLDVLADRSALALEPIAIDAMEQALLLELEQPIDRDPATHARVRAMPHRLARFPDPGIGLAPVIADVPPV